MTTDHYYKRQSLFKTSLPWLVFVLYILYFFIQLLPFHAGKDFHLTYFSAEHFYTDWHPFWMKLKLNYIANLLFSDNLAEQMIQPVGFYFSILWITANIFIIKSILKLGYKPYVYLASLFIISHFYVSFFSEMTADLGFFCHLCLLISIIYYCRICQYRSRIIFFLSLILLCDVVTWRHQAILLLPLFLWYILKIYPQKAPFSHLRLCITSGILSVLIIIGINVGYYHIYSIKKTHPEQVMMYSDIENISSMKKDFTFKQDFKDHIGFYPYQTKDDGEESSPMGHVGQSYSPENPNENATSVWKNAKYFPFMQSKWTEYIKKYPREFLISRAICYTQLLYVGAVPKPIERLFKKSYPHTPIYSLRSYYTPNQNVFQTFADLRRGGASVIHILLRSHLFRNHLHSALIIPVYTAIFIWLLLSVPIMWLVKKNRQASHYDFVRITAATSIIYLIGFIPFTPTSDLRFSTPAIILGVLSILLFITLRKHKTSEESSASEQ